MTHRPNNLPPQQQVPRWFGLIPAAGIGSRVGGPIPKQYLPLGASTVLQTALNCLLTAKPKQVLVVLAPADKHATPLALGDGVTLVYEGGATRSESVQAGLRALLRQGAHGQDWVLVHDAARPGLSVQALQALLAAGSNHPVGAYLALPCADTVRQILGGDVLALPREQLWLAQTPQMFRISDLLLALQQMPQATDEASAMMLWAKQHGLAMPAIVPGERANFKVTTAEDLALMQTIVGNALPAFRIGQGYDVHALVPGRPLIIGGVAINHPTGLLGHSDADVLLHAITDALLGAAGLGDIGQNFPDTDPAFAGIDSRHLLRSAVQKVRAKGWVPVNVDASVLAQAPKLASHIAAMCALIANDLGLDAERVNVKAKTGERLGFVGRQEGIEAHASVLLQKLG
jgi:2-C-methyl-D-erythritol 4-phosphate cytidylyltransferase / 2-C-methyl-D-erythritol 2,4-cyclodiphosphate synthase